MIKTVEQIGNYNLIGAKITSFSRIADVAIAYADLRLTDDEFARTGVRMLSFMLHHTKITPETSRGELISAVISGIEFDSESKCASVSLKTKGGGEINPAVEFESLDCKEFEYEGMSFENVYEKCMQHNSRYDYIFSGEYEEDTKEYDAGCGYTLRTTDYHAVDRNSGTELHITVLKGVLLKDGEEIFSYRAYDGSPKNAAQVIRHSSGREYFLFKENLYGMSVLDIASGGIYHHIPAGEQHDKDFPCGESFIITDIHYDEASDLIALGGCFWASSYGVMVADFSDPMNYSPHFVNLLELAMLQYPQFFDMDFSDWDNANKKLNCAGDGKPISFTFDELRDAIKSGEYSYCTTDRDLL